MESLFFEPEIVDSLFLQHNDLILSTFEKTGESSPPPAILTTLARISLFPHITIASLSLLALFEIFKRNPLTFSLLPSPIFPSSSPHQHYSGLSFLDALTKKLRIVFSEVQRNIPTDLSFIPKYLQHTSDDPFIIKRTLDFCSYSFLLTIPLLRASPHIEVDSEIIRELILFVKEALTTILTNISTIDNIIASLPSDPSPTTRLASEIDTRMIDSLRQLRDDCEVFLFNEWRFFVNLTFDIAEPHKSSFQTIILDDPSFPDLILNSLKLNHKDIRLHTIMAIVNIVIEYPRMKEQFMAANLVGRMFETVDFVSLPLSESETLLGLTKFITYMLDPIGDDEDAHFEQYPLVRVSVFEPAKQFITFMFHNSDKLILTEADNLQLECHICWIHQHIKNMELRSDEHNADIVSELVNWEVRTMVEMENEEHFQNVLQSMLNRTWEWNRNKRERQTRREVLLREEGLGRFLRIASGGDRCGHKSDHPRLCETVQNRSIIEYGRTLMNVGNNHSLITKKHQILRRDRPSYPVFVKKTKSFIVSNLLFTSLHCMSSSTI